MLNFSAGPNLTVGSLPYAITTADFNGDLSPDLAVSNRNSANISLFLNNTPVASGDFNFTGEDLYTGSFPTGIVSADFNGDGKPDLATATSYVTILVNNTPDKATKPTFYPRQEYPFGATPYAIGSADFNGDNRPDLVTVNGNDQTISVLLNNTAAKSTKILFLLAQNFTIGKQTRNFANLTIADFNQDGKPDIAIANQEGRNISVLMNNTPTDSFTTKFSQSFVGKTINQTFSIASGDFNRDGKIDLATRTGEGDNASVYTLINETPLNGSFAVFRDAGFTPTSSDISALAIADFDRNDFVDLVGVDRNNPNLSSFLNNNDPNAVFTSEEIITTDTQHGAIIPVDINLDGKIDLAVTNPNNNTISLLRNSTNPVIFPAEPIIGTDENENLSGGELNDTIRGFGGNDTLGGFDGNDLLFGGMGNDLIYGNSGFDGLNGQEGDDTLNGGKDRDLLIGDIGQDSLGGNDLIYGNNNSDTILGGVGDDVMLGGKGDDSINGEDGNDFISGDAGNDTLTGGFGQDIFALRRGGGIDTIIDFTPGVDVLGLAGDLQVKDIRSRQNGIFTNILVGDEILATVGVNANILTTTDLIKVDI